MDELKKLIRVIKKIDSSAPHEKLLTIDASAGQNAFQQAKMFNKEIGLTGIVLNKIDGTAKGGIVFNICKNLQIPIKYLGVGQEPEDLEQFNAQKYVEAII